MSLNNILILGAHGMLGTDLVKVFDVQYNVTAWDKAELDITNEQEIISKIHNKDFDLIINASGYTDVEGAEDNAELAFLINNEAVKNLVEAAKSSQAKFVHFSTEYVFDGTNPYGYNEMAPGHPINVYGRSKLAGELHVLAYDYGYVVRTSWLYGHNPQVGKPRGLNFIDTMLSLAAKGSEIKVVSDQFGKLTYTKDLAAAVLNLIKSDKPAGIYHLVNENKTSWYDVAKEIFTIKNIDIKLAAISSSEYPAKAKRPLNAVLLNTKFNKLRPWSEALKDYLNHNL